MGLLRQPTRLLPILLALFGFLAFVVSPEALQAADNPSYTFNPKNESGDPAKGWYIHLPPPFTAADVVIKDSGGKILKDVRVIDRGRRTGVTVLFETAGVGVPNNGTDELKLTLTKPLGKTGTSGFRDKDGVKGVPIGEVTWDPPWTDSKGGTGGTKPKEGKKPQEAPPEEEEPPFQSDQTVFAEDLETGFEEGGEAMQWISYPYSSEETNDELFGDWADGEEWDEDEAELESVDVPVESVHPILIEPVLQY